MGKTQCYVAAMSKIKYYGWLGYLLSLAYLQSTVAGTQYLSATIHNSTVSDSLLPRKKSTQLLDPGLHIHHRWGSSTSGDGRLLIGAAVAFTRSSLG
jgi:hypothetical protein